MPRSKPKSVTADRFLPRARELATFKTISCYPAEWDALVRYSEANQFKTPMDVIREMAHVQLPGTVAKEFRQPKFLREKTPAGSRDQSPAPRSRPPRPA